MVRALYGYFQPAMFNALSIEQAPQFLQARADCQRAFGRGDADGLARAGTNSKLEYLNFGAASIRPSGAQKFAEALADDGAVDQKTVAQAIEKYGIDPDRPDPVTL